MQYNTISLFTSYTKNVQCQSVPRCYRTISVYTSGVERSHNDDSQRERSKCPISVLARLLLLFSSSRRRALPWCCIVRHIRIQVQALDPVRAHIEPSILDRRLNLTECLQRAVLPQGFASSLFALLVRSLENSTWLVRGGLALASSLPITPSGKSLFRRLELFRLLRLRFELGLDRSVEFPGLFEAVFFLAAEAVAAVR